jgi:CheY-like chemotaxis protein
VGGHILVVEDDDALRDALCDALELEGYRVVGAQHGGVALAHLRTAPRPCLILLDLMMPVMDGRVFRQAMLAIESVADIPVVMITAAGPHLVVNVPVAEILHKPLQMDLVMKVVQAYCGPASLAVGATQTHSPPAGNLSVPQVPKR